MDNQQLNKDLKKHNYKITIPLSFAIWMFGTYFYVGGGVGEAIMGGVSMAGIILFVGEIVGFIKSIRKNK